jgi:hypothetical protein
MRLYCGRVGSVFEALPDGGCPECAHRVETSGLCGAFVPCLGDPYVSPHGHPCELAVGHDGGRRHCSCAGAQAACRARVPSKPVESAP